MIPGRQQQSAGPIFPHLSSVTEVFPSPCCVTVLVRERPGDSAPCLKCLQQLLQILNYPPLCDAWKTGQKPHGNQAIGQSLRVGDPETRSSLSSPQGRKSSLFCGSEKGGSQVAAHAPTQLFVRLAMGFDSKWDFHVCDIPFMLLIVGPPLRYLSTWLVGHGREDEECQTG